MTSQWARCLGNLFDLMSSSSSFSMSSSCFSKRPMRSVKVVRERARFIFRSRWRFSFARVEEVESDDDVRLIFAGVLCQELRVGAACCAVMVNNWPPVGVWSTGFFLRSLAGLSSETACLALRQRRFAAGVGGAWTSSGLPSSTIASSVCRLNDTTCLISLSFVSLGLPSSSKDSPRGRSPGAALISGLLSASKNGQTQPKGVTSGSRSATSVTSTEAAAAFRCLRAPASREI